MFQPGAIVVSDVYHLPIIKAFAARIDLVNISNRLTPRNMAIAPGILVLVLVLAMALDVLSRRHPLYPNGFGGSRQPIRCPHAARTWVARASA
jgi:hypothetical protein